jgi:transposase
MAPRPSLRHDSGAPGAEPAVRAAPRPHRRYLGKLAEAAPGHGIIARARAGAYAAGARDGAPDAEQVADRGHVLRNLGDAVRSAVERCHAVSKRVVREIAGNADPAATRAIAAVLESTVTVPDHVAHTNSSRRSLFDEASRLHVAGTSIVRISRPLGADRKTLRRWLRAGALPTWRQPRRARMIDAHLAFLERRWAEGCRNASLLWRELVHAGFRGRYATVKDWAARRRDAEAGANAMQPGRQTGCEPPPSRRTTRLLMAESDAVDPIDGRFIARLLETSPDLASTAAAAKRLAALLRRKGDEALADVLTAADATMIRSFVVELRKDIDAVQASLKLPWTTSPVEG